MRRALLLSYHSCPTATLGEGDTGSRAARQYTQTFRWDVVARHLVYSVSKIFRGRPA